jgi:predicted ester cyclase
MTAEELLLPIRSHDDILVGNKEHLIDEIYADYFVNLSPGIPDEQRHGREAVRNHNRYLHQAFSDIEVVNEAPVVEGDMIAFRWVFTATHTGNFYGVPATGKRVTIDGYDIMQISGGKITKAWVYQDTASLFAQFAMP